MIFNEAVLKMLDGARVRRKGATSYYYTVLQNQDYIWKVLDHFSPPKVFEYCPSVDDLLANDWEVLK